MVSRMTGAVTVHAGRPGLIFVRDGRVRTVISTVQLRLLLALASGEPMPVREAARVIWPNQPGMLTGSQRASAARSVTRLIGRQLISQKTVGQPLTLSDAGRDLLRRHGEVVHAIVTAAAPVGIPDD
jgi:hypothetical protein